MDVRPFLLFAIRKLVLTTFVSTVVQVRGTSLSWPWTLFLARSLFEHLRYPRFAHRIFLITDQSSPLALTGVASLLQLLCDLFAIIQEIRLGYPVPIHLIPRTNSQQSAQKSTESTRSTRIHEIHRNPQDPQVPGSLLISVSTDDLRHDLQPP